MKTVRLIQGLLIFIPVCLMGWVLWVELVPTGEFPVHFVMGDRSPYIDRLLPDSRVSFVSTDEETVAHLTGEPVYFFAHPHRGFTSVDLTVTYQNHGAELIELGGLATGGGEQYVLQPVENQVIDRSSWNRLEEDGWVLLQRNKTYASLEAFLTDPPPLSEIATSHADAPGVFRLSGHVSGREDVSYHYPVMGSHQVKVYVKDEELRFDLTFGVGEGFSPPLETESAVRLELFDENQRPLASAVPEHDGLVSLRVPDLPEGPYTINVHASDATVFERLKTPQKKWVWMNQVTFSDHDAEGPLQLVSEGCDYSFEAKDTSGAQPVQVGNQTVDIPTPLTLVHASGSPSGLTSLTLPSGALRLVTNGHIAFDEKHFFNPDPVRLLPGVDLDQRGINYMYAKYVPPTKNQDWSTATVHFDTKDLDFTNRTWKFAFSIPRIKAQGASVDVKSIEMVWRREPLSWKEVVEKVRRTFGMVMIKVGK